MVPGDFPSVTYPWLAARDRLGMRIRWVRDTPDRDLTLALGDAISERTTVVCVSPVQFATGSQVDVAALVARARDVGARVVVDVTQMAGAAPVTMTHWGVDALVCRYSSRNGAVTCSFLVGVAGFEPAASSSRTEHADHQSRCLMTFQSRVVWAAQKRSFCRVASLTPEIVRCPGRVGSADRWAARIIRTNRHCRPSPRPAHHLGWLGFGGPFRTIP